jgi:hypothetical protein
MRAGPEAPGSARPAARRWRKDLPRAPAASAAPPSPLPPTAAAGAAGRVPGGGGIEAATIGTTAYLLPGEHKRVRRLALDTL